MDYRNDNFIRRVDTMTPTIYSRLYPHIYALTESFGEERYANFAKDDLDRMTNEIMRRGNFATEMPAGYTRNTLDDIIRMMLIMALRERRYCVYMRYEAERTGFTPYDDDYYRNSYDPYDHSRNVYYGYGNPYDNRDSYDNRNSYDDRGGFDDRPNDRDRPRSNRERFLERYHYRERFNDRDRYNGRERFNDRNR